MSPTSCQLLYLADETRAEIFTELFPLVAGQPDILDPSLTEVSSCLDQMLDQVYGT